VNWFDVDSALNRIQAFLTRWSAAIANLDRNVRPSSMFECYSFISIVDAYASCNFNVQRMGPSGQVIFKRSVTAIPNRYTYFVVSLQNTTHEIRLNQAYKNADDVFFNLDVTISKGRDCLNKGTLESQDIFTFCECKHYRNFYPSTCANFLGLARIVMPSNILWKDFRNPSPRPYPPPALLVSGSASSYVHNMVSLVKNRQFHLRFFGNISPRGHTMTTLTDWISRRI
jgi:hypothetical protein